MSDPGGACVAVYIDFDNIVISRYDQLFGRGQFQRDKVRGFDDTDKSADPDIVEKLLDESNPWMVRLSPAMTGP